MNIFFPSSSNRGKFGVAANVTIESSEESSGNPEVPQTCALGRDKGDVAKGTSIKVQ